MLTRTRYLNIRFANRIMPWEIPYFRAAVIEASHRKSSLFHNHAGDHEYIYRYPLIQYKVLNKKASIVCINDGTDDIHYLLQNRHFNFRINGHEERYLIEDVRLRYVNIQTWQHTFTYNILNWIPLNQDNYRRYQNTPGLADRIAMLEDILRGHFHALADGIGWDIERGPQPLDVRIRKILSERYLAHKGHHHLTFHVDIDTNVSLPDYIGIGKGVSAGFGILKRVRGLEQHGKVYRRKPTGVSHIQNEEE